MAKIKKIALAAMALSLAGAMCGCGGEKTPAVSEMEGEKTLTYWVAMPTQISANFTSMNEMPVYQELEKKTGVHLDFTHVQPDQEQEKFTLLIASGNLPDIVETNWKKYYQGGLTKAAQDNLIIYLDDYLDKYAPNFKKVMDENDASRKSTITSDGHYCAFPMIRQSDEEAKKQIKTNFGGMIIRKDWLDKCGLPVPETIDEWDKALRAFKTQLGVESPLMIESGWFKIEGGGNHFNNAFGVDLGWFVKDGKVKLGPYEPEYKDFIAKMHEWYEEGLLASEFDTTSTSTTISEIAEGNIGAAYEFVSGTAKILNSANLQEGFEVVGTQYPVKNKGDEPYFMCSASFSQSPYIAITKSCKNPEMAVSWADYLYSEEGSMLNYYGIEGDTYTRDGDTIAYTDKIMHDVDGLPPTTALAKYVRSFTSIPGLAPKLKSTISKYDKPVLQEAYETYNKYTANVFDVQIPQFEYPADVAEEVSAMEFDINNYVWEYVINLIKGTESMDNYDQFVQGLKELNVERLIEIKQQSYDEYMAK